MGVIWSFIMEAIVFLNSLDFIENLDAIRGSDSESVLRIQKGRKFAEIEPIEESSIEVHIREITFTFQSRDQHVYHVWKSLSGRDTIRASKYTVL